MYYFKFQIPTNQDGSRVSYSPNWHGAMPKTPKSVIVLLYNDKEGWGIAKTDDSFVPPEVKVISKDEKGVFFGDKLLRRWDKAAGEVV